MGSLFAFLLISIICSTRITGLLFPRHTNKCIKRFNSNCENNDAWDHGEVAWEFDRFSNIDDEMFIVNKTHKPPYIGLLNNNTPLYHVISMDQTKIASMSVIIKATYKEIFNTDAIFAVFNKNITPEFAVMPSDVAIFAMITGLVFTYNKTNNDEMNRVNKLYIFDQSQDYNAKYIKIRRYITMIFIIVTCLTTKNVQRAE